MKSKLPIAPSRILISLVLVSIVCLASCGRACNKSVSQPDQPQVPAGPVATSSANSKDQPPEKLDEDKDDSVAVGSETIAAKIRSSVRQLLSTVFRIRGGAQQLVSDRTYPLKTGDRIKTNDSGTAQVNIADCMTVYVFASSGLTMSTCPGFARGSAVCSSSGTSLFNNRCLSHIRRVETDTAEIRLEGTYFRVAYWPEKKRTIIDVHEGPVRVRQLLDARRRKFDKAVQIDAGCWCAPSDNCFVPGVPTNGPQPCTKLTPENAAYLARTTKESSGRATQDHTPIAPGPTIEGPSSGPGPDPTSGVSNTDTVDFGQVEIGLESVKSLTITNISSLPLRFTSVSLNDPIHYFEIGDNTCPNVGLEMGKACKIDVSFKPLDPGSYLRFMEIADNAKGSPRKISVKGSAVPGWAATTLIQPLALQFKEQSVGTTSTTQRITISKGKPIAPPSFEGPAKGDFKIVSNDCTDAKSLCEIEVTFVPTVAGEREATLVISPPTSGPGGAVEPRKVVALHGVSTPNAPDPATLSPVLKLPTSKVCFNAHKVVDPKAVQVRKLETITVTNAGKGPLLIKDLIPSTKDFVVKSQTCIGAKVTERCDIAVGFTPVDTGVRSGTLTIINNDPNSPTKEVRLAGRGKNRNWFIRGVQWLFRINQGDDCKF